MAENNHPLARYRREHGLTQAALASELGVWPLTVWRWENRERAPRMKDARRLSVKTGISVGELIEASSKEATQ
jgi:transcriptional regulator with XRE-family HTH domain